MDVPAANLERVTGGSRVTFSNDGESVGSRGYSGVSSAKLEESDSFCSQSRFPPCCVEVLV